MAASRFHTSRYQREQRFTIVSWSLLTAVGVLLVAVHHYATEESASSDESAMSPAAPTVTMHAWLDESQPAINVLVSARNTIAAAASRRDIPGTGRACQAATDAVASLRVHLPSPEPTLNQSLQQAVSSYTVGLPDCVSASRTVDGEGMQRAAGWISDGDTAMQSALDLLADEADPASGGLGVLIV